VSLAIGVDIGGTKVAAGVVDVGGQIIDGERRPTPGTDIGRTEQVIVDLVELLRARHRVEGIGVGAAGWLSRDRATVMFSPHLAWRDEPLQARLTARLGGNVLVENDANASAWAEYRFGAGRGARALACVTLGTGIGGGLVIDGDLYRGAFGAATEYGHMTVVPGGRACACGEYGCWEMYASGTALADQARELAREDLPAARQLIELCDGSLDGVTGETVLAAASRGDTLAARACMLVGEWLGRGLVNLAAVLDPDVFVIGGGASDAGALVLDPARATFAANLPGRGYRPMARIVGATLGPQAGVVGAADLARCQLNTS
jgi:glucokinase